MPAASDLNIAIDILRKGGLVGIPTETVYGLAGDIRSESAISDIFRVKGRPSFNPLIVHIGDRGQLVGLVRNIPSLAQVLMDHFWPGPLTLIFPKSREVSLQITGGLETVAVRMPAHPLTLELLQRGDLALAAPSANPFGRVSPTTAEHVRRYFNEKEVFVLDGGPCAKGIESTIIGFDTDDRPVMYRQGSVSREAAESVAGPVIMHTMEDDQPLSPGMLTRHYSPGADSVLTTNLMASIFEHKGKRIGVLSLGSASSQEGVAHWECLSPSGDLEEAMRNLYAAMHRLDKAALDILLFERMPDKGLGCSINDRLQRATAK
jgi:L-threonylcarbamoyladenylate synthase